MLIETCRSTGAVTFRVSAMELLVKKWLSPLYTATTVCGPAVQLETFKYAMLPIRLAGGCDRPSNVNVTVPLMVQGAAAVRMTKAVKTTVLPATHRAGAAR